MSGNEGGGKNAADELHARTKDYLKGLNVDATNTEVIVKAYADFKGLQRACLKNGKMKNGASLSLFAHGFNQRQGLFDFIDFGAGKEGADNKVRGKSNSIEVANVDTDKSSRMPELLRRQLAMQTHCPWGLS